MTRKYPVIRRANAPEPYAKDVIDALRHGPNDEKAHATASFVVPTAKQLMQAEGFDEMMAMAKAEKPRHGVAMSQVEIGGDGAPFTQTLERPVGLGFGQLRATVRGNPILQLIINTRIRQVQRFIRQPQYDYQPGFKMRFRDLDRRIGDADKERFTWLRRYLMNCGAEFDPRQRRALQRDSLYDFTAKSLRDSLTMDAAPIELSMTASQRVHGFYAVDGAKVFLTDPNIGLQDDFAGPAEFNRLVGRTNFGDPRNIIAVYAQGGQIKAQYTHMDLLYPVRNKTSEEEYYGYGMAEPEHILQVGTAFLNAFTMNARNISDNAIPRGILSILGDYQDEDIEELKNQWTGQLRGATNRFRLPVLVGEAETGSGVNFIPTGAQVDDALFSRWMTLLVAISCATYLIDPAEISFESFSAGGASTLSGSDTEAKLTSSADKGLHTLLEWHSTNLNELVQLVDDEVEMYWTGLDSTKEDDQQREQLIMTFREVRERHGHSNDGIDDAVLNAPVGVAGQAYMSVLGNKQQQDMQAQQPQGGPDEQDPQAAQDPEDPQQAQDPEDPQQPQPGPAGGPQQIADSQGQQYAATGQPDSMAKAYQPSLFDVWPAGVE